MINIRVLFIIQVVITPFLPMGFSRVSARKTRQPEPSRPDPTRVRHIKWPQEEDSRHISRSLTRVDRVWPRFDQTVSDPTGVRYAQKTLETQSRIHFPEFREFWLSLTKFDQGWPSLTEVWPNRWPDQKLNRTDHPLTNAWSTLRASIWYFTGQKRTRNERVMVETVKNRSNT
jgi:hypothetical protein